MKVKEYGKITAPSEGEIQAAFFSWLAEHEKQHPELALFYSIPNGANKSIAARMKFKREGLKAGVPDCHLPIAKGIDVGLWIEFKSAKGKTSEAQADWGRRLLSKGHAVYICKSWTDAANIVIDYLNLPIKKFDTIEIVKRAVGK